MNRVLPLSCVLLALNVADANDAIPVAYRNIALTTQVPVDILYAMALQESRLAIHAHKTIPWPWTINISGNGVRFNSRQQMLNAIRTAKLSGTKSIDVGVMQVNLHYHGHRFQSLSDAVDPYTNIKVAVEILKEEYQHCEQDWWCGVGRYHSYREKTADHYRAGVRRQWRNLTQH